jgi:hypothetical protein
MSHWLPLQNRKWTADRVRARGLQQEFETANHLVLHCPFAKEVWNQFQGSNPSAVQIAGSFAILSGWWNKVRRDKINEQKKEISLSSYIIWHI